MKKNKIIVGLYLSSGMDSGGIFQYSQSVLEALKILDRKIVLNSAILKWNVVEKEFKERINF